MANGAFKFKDNSGNVVSFISGSGSNISFSGGTLDLSGMTGLTLGNLTLSGTTQNAISTSHAASYLLTSSFNTYSGTTDTVIGTLQTSTSSLNSFTSSATTRLDNIETSSGSLNSYTSSNNTKLGVIESTTGSLNSYTSSNTTNINAIHTSTGSLNSFTSSATTRLNSVEGVSGSYATTGSNQFKNDQVITGSLTVTGFIDAQELRTTYISSSILYRSGSTKFGDELSDTHAFTGSLLVSGTISIPGSNLVSGSSQILNGSGVFSGSAQLPSGIVSSSAQTIANLPSGTVSGSVQVDVMSTTNIARLATTGSNTFTGIQSIGTSESPTSGGNLLRVFGSGSATNMQVFTTTNHATFFEANTNSGSIVARLQSQTAPFVGTLTNNTFDIVAGGNVIIRTTGSGLVGINKSTTPNATLDVNGNTIVSGSLTTTGNISINSTSTTQLNVFTSSVSTQNIMSEFYNGDYTTNTRNFIRVRNGINAGGTMSSYFGQGQDGKTYIISNDFTKNHIVIDGNSTFVGINKNTPNSQLDVNGDTTVSGSIYMTTNTNSGSPINVRNTNAGTSAYSGMHIGNNDRVNGGGIVLSSTGYNGGTIFGTDVTYLYNNGTGGIGIASESGTGVIKFGTA